MAGLDEAQCKGVERKNQHLQNRGAPSALVHIAHRAAQLIGQHHQHQRGRHELRDGARRCQHPSGVTHVVAVADHHRQGNQRHGNHLASHRARNGAQNKADDDDRIAQAAAHGPKQLAHGVQHVFGQATFFKYGPHKGEEGNGQQQVIAQNAKDIEGQVGHEAGRKPAHFNSKETAVKP